MSTVPLKSQVYKKQGAPLSEAAQYRAQLKSGSFNQPSRSSVVDIASGAKAALLAAKSDLAIDAYERSLSKEAESAAKSLSKLVVEPTTASSNYSTSSYSANNASSASSASAAAASLRSPKSRAPLVSPTKSSLDSANAAKSSVVSSRAESKRLATQPKIVNSAQKMDMRNIGSRAQSAATDAIAARISSPLSSPTQMSSPIDFAALSRRASINAHAAATVSEPVTAKRNSVLDQRVLAMARANAATTLKSIDSRNNEAYLFSNHMYNEKAMQIAKQRSAAREEQSKDGQYNLGGGLYMPVADVEAIARRFVEPVLSDISVQAEKQRLLDEEYAQEQARLKHERLEHEEHLRQLKAEEKRIKKEEEDERKAAISAEKQSYQAKKQELERLKSAEVKKQKQILKETEEKHDLTMRQLAKEKDVEKNKLSKELTAFKTAKHEELKKLNDEQFAVLQPIVEKLEKERRAHDALVEEQKMYEEIAQLDEQKLITCEDLLAKSKVQLEKAQAKYALAQAELEKSEGDAEKIKAQSELDEARFEVEKKITAQKQTMADQKAAKEESERSRSEQQKNAKEIELKNQAIAALEEERQFAELKPGVNSTKIAALEAEIAALDGRIADNKEKEERKKYEEAIAEHDKTINRLMKEKQELVDQEEAILAELKKSDEEWKEIEEKYDDELGGSPVIVDWHGEEDEVEAEVEAKEEAKEVNSKRGPQTPKSATKAPAKSPLKSPTRSPIKESGFFLTKVVNNLKVQGKKLRDNAASDQVTKKDSDPETKIVKAQVEETEKASSSSAKKEGKKTISGNNNNNNTEQLADLDHQFSNFTSGSFVEDVDGDDEEFDEEEEEEEEAAVFRNRAKLFDFDENVEREKGKAFFSEGK